MKRFTNNLSDMAVLIFDSLFYFELTKDYCININSGLDVQSVFESYISACTFVPVVSWFTFNGLVGMCKLDRIIFKTGSLFGGERAMLAVSFFQLLSLAHLIGCWQECQSAFPKMLNFCFE